MFQAKLTILIYQGKTQIRREFINQSIIKIGRDPKSHLRLDDAAAARHHAVINVSEAGLTLVNLGHDAGTLVNGVRVAKCPLSVGDTIQIGDTQLRVERVDVSTASQIGACEPAHPSSTIASPLPAVAHNFLAGVPNWVSVHERVSAKQYGYALIKSGPDVRSQEVEIPNSMAVEVTVLWGSTVLHVAHVVPPGSFSVGEVTGKNVPCDFFMPEEILGVPWLSLLDTAGSSPVIHIPRQAQGHLDQLGKSRISLDGAKRQANSSTLADGSVDVSLPLGARASLQFGDFTFQLAAVRAGKPSKRGLSAGVEREVICFFGLSLAAVASFVTSMAFFVPSQVGLEDDTLNQDQVYAITQFLRAAAERETDAKASEQVASVDANDREGGTGTRAQHEEGAMGKPTAKADNGCYAVHGPRDNPDPHVARDRLLWEATHGGIIGLLNSGAAGDPNAPTAPWGRDEALGRDDLSADGNMWGDHIGESYGLHGLGLSGLGEGGGGVGEGIGLGSIGTIDRGSGTGPGQGFGPGNGGLGHGAHKTRVPSVRPGPNTTVSGRLPPEVIQRIVRQNYGRFRSCYELGLSRNPNLEGRIQVRFIIDRDGTVSNAQNGGSDLPDSAVVSCVIGAYYGLNFPQPEGGIVTVVYPIMFQPG